MKRRLYGIRDRHFPALCLMICLAALVTGCGGKEAVPTSAEAQETQNGDTTRQVELLKPEQTSAAMAQMEIDEETRKELTAQLLEENELDTSVLESRRRTKGCTFELPEGFEEAEDRKGMYVTGRYPIDASTIYSVTGEQDISLQLMTEETFKEQTQENLRELYGEEVTLNIDSFESIRIDGYPAFRILCHYQVEDIQITQLQYVINADKSYMVIYSQTSDYDRMEEYEASAATIKIE